MAGYDANKAAVFNKLRQQGLTEDQAAAQAGISNADFGNYSMGDNGQLGALDPGGGKKAGVDYERYSPQEEAESARFNAGLSSSKNFEQVDYAQTARSEPTPAKPISYTTTSTETVSGGGTQSVIAGPRIPNNESKAIGTAYQAKQDEYNQFIKDNPSDFQRKKQGLPPMSPEEKAAYQEKLDTLNKEKSELKQQQIDAETAGPPTETTTPNTTTTTTTVTTGKSTTNDPVNEQNDQQVFNQTETQLGSTVPVPTTRQPGDVEVPAAAADGAEGPLTITAADSDETGFPPPPEFGDQPEPTLTAADVDPMSDEEVAQLEERQAQNRAQLQAENYQPEPVPPSQTGYSGAAYDDEGNLMPGFTTDENNNAVFVGGDFVEPATQALAEEARTKAKLAEAQQQSTIQQRFNQSTQGDWRVRLSLATGSDYLYNSNDPGILKALRTTNGVIFPYTPNIQTNYNANYDKYELTHSNHRGYFYKNSSVADIQITGTFTAQDTAEATYLLAVIHFFRSVTKMFYGQDQQRGAPPPLCFLDGMGQYQFNNHPVLVSSFQYNLPADVDYIRVDPNNQGLSLAPRQALTSSSPGSTLSSVINRLKNAGLPKGANVSGPADLGTVQQKVSGTGQTTYVPTRIEISITLLPVNTRSQVSQQFSLNRFANGDLLKQGFW
jgi:hypothetical protein